METAVNGRHLLHELALIYISLAHGTDEELSQDEIDVIGNRLRRWQHVKSETVVSALKEALDAYVSEGAEQRIEEAIRSVRTSLAEDLRQYVLDDLTGIAMADGHVVFEEAMFIGDLARAWGLNLPQGETEQGGSWNVLTGDDLGDGWSLLHDLATLYVILAHDPDGDLCDEEVETIRARLSEWLPNASEEQINALLREALTVAVQGPDERIFASSVSAVRNGVPAHQRTALLEDLRSVAAADGVLHDRERELIARLEKAWESLEG